MAVPSYPFRPRNPAYPTTESILIDETFTAYPRHSPEHQAAFDRANSDEARRLRLQYLSIEEELDRAFRYVSPCEHNANTFSFKFAETIRSAANMYEILSKDLYSKFYNSNDSLNIYNYLALDVYLNLADQKVTLVVAHDSFPAYPEVTRPFFGLVCWDRASPVADYQKPIWWSAYNDIKHSNAGIMAQATLANAVAAVAAIFLVIERVYGFGILGGGFRDLPTGSFTYFPRWSRLFSRYSY